MNAPRSRAEARALATATAPWFPGQRAIRSIVGALVVLVPLANGLAAAAISYLQAQTDVDVPGQVFIWLNAIVAGTALVIGLVSRLMAVPGFNAALARVGLGTAPRSAITVAEDAAGAYAFVTPDTRYQNT